MKVNGYFRTFFAGRAVRPLSGLNFIEEVLMELSGELFSLHFPVSLAALPMQPYGGPSCLLASAAGPELCMCSWGVVDSDYAWLSARRLIAWEFSPRWELLL